MKIDFYSAITIDKQYLNIQQLPIIIFERNKQVYSLTIGWLIFAAMIVYTNQEKSITNEKRNH